MDILLCIFMLAVASSEAIKRQWASEVTGFSSQYNTGGFSAKQILGKPNVYPRYGDSSGTWTQASGQLNENQFIQVRFPEKVWLTEVNIYETYNAGTVKRILARDKENQWMEIFKVFRVHLIRKARKFSPKLKKVNFPVNELRIEVDCSVSPSWVEIDAVEIVGENKGECPAQYRKMWDSCYLIKKDKVSADT
ncbi:F-box/LRR-repeat protein 4-like, partial [Saccostrea cucullata]|uniref:F-box/LRR-repeat protein 4-like n=1 Tax=Saccostrea cuccullata TaxID=36930 RepID=UPI002ED606F5